MASALPDCTAAVTLAWSASTSTVDLGLAGVGALLACAGEVVVGLHGALLHGDALAAGVVGVDPLGLPFG